MDFPWIALTEVRFLLVTNQDWLGENSQSLQESKRLVPKGFFTAIKQRARGMYLVKG
jgi:hypothetical protein